MLPYTLDNNLIYSYGSGLFNPGDKNIVDNRYLLLYQPLVGAYRNEIQSQYLRQNSENDDFVLLKKKGKVK